MKKIDNEDRLAAWIDRTIKEFTDNSPENSLGKGTDEKAWGEPSSRSQEETIRFTQSFEGISAIFTGPPG